jgi:DNA-binding CsgD family transcriptional regulator
VSRVTAAERAAIDAIGKHGTVKAAAFALGKSPRTVEQQLRTARERVGVDTTVQLVSTVLARPT